MTVEARDCFVFDSGVKDINDCDEAELRFVIRYLMRDNKLLRDMAFRPPLIFTRGLQNADGSHTTA